MLKALEISGFKSFAKKTELTFKSKITAIVGPNGSGKSNVAEAFRFALGEQSMKSLRGKRGEDLIWNGSQEVGRANRAAVKLAFDNSPAGEAGRKIFNLDFDEVVLERVVSRDGSNEYLLNGSQVRLKDTIELLAEAHIGASGHHIISQGEADRVLSASIKERREMIEDALGLKIYQYKREESERKLEKTQENMRQVESLRREVAPHLKFLKKQAERVEKAEELRLKLVESYREYLKREKTFIETQKENLKNQKAPLAEKLKELDQAMEEAKKVLDESATKDEKSEKLINIENEIKSKRDDRDRLYREAGKIEGELGANERNIEKINADLQSEENKTIPLKEVEDLEREISTFAEIRQVLERLRAFIMSHKSRSDSRVLDELRETNQTLSQNKIQLEEKIQEAGAALVELDAQYQKIKRSIEQEKDSSREAERAIFKIGAEQADLHGKLNLVELETKRLQSIEEDWKREIQEGGVLLGTAILGFENLELPEMPDYPEKRDELYRELEKKKIRLEELGGGAEASEVMKEYHDTLERDLFLTRELEDLKKSAESLETLIKELLQKLDIEFKAGIEKINKSFNEYFALMFGGGDAKLEVVKSLKLRAKSLESEDEIGSLIGQTEEKEEREGIEISVSLPRKRIKSLEMLSGGERALTSIALLFAISQVNPPPFIILDETDAALDEANSKKYGDMIENLSRVSQLILITHNRETMSRAGVIYGVTMGKDGVSRLLSIAFDEAVAVAK